MNTYCIGRCQEQCQSSSVGRMISVVPLQCMSRHTLYEPRGDGELKGCSDALWFRRKRDLQQYYKWCPCRKSLSRGLLEQTFFHRSKVIQSTTRRDASLCRSNRQRKGWFGYARRCTYSRNLFLWVDEKQLVDFISEFIVPGTSGKASCEETRRC